MLGHDKGTIRARKGSFMANTRIRRGVGSIRRLKSGKYQVRYTDPNGKRSSLGTYFLKDQAEKVLKQLERDIDSGFWQDPEQLTALNSSSSLREVAQYYREISRGTQGRPLAPNTIHEYERYIEIILKHLADKPIGKITEHDIEKWWMVESKRRGNQTSKVYSHLKSVFTYAIKKKIIRQNPCVIDGASNFVPETRRQIPTHEQVEIFIANSSPQYALIIALASMGGLRKSEVLDLRKKDIQRKESEGRIFYQVDVHKGVSWVNGVPVSRPPKTQNSIRILELPEAINPILSKHLSNVPIHPEALVFPRSPETPELHFSKHQLQRTWEKIRAVAGYSGGYHSLRHYHLTRYAQAGATAQEIMDRGGHADMKIALTYQRSTGRDRDLIANW